MGTGGAMLALCTICLNEMEWLPKLYEQHKDWDKLYKWIFVEGADSVYARCNPSLVSENGLSVDGTSEFLEQLAKQDDRIVYIRHGLAESKNASQHKIVLRNRYLEYLDDYVNVGYLVVVDADEFYTHEAQRLVLEKIAKAPKDTTSFCFKQHEIWRPPSIQHRRLFSYEVSGGYWNVKHVRVWKHFIGMRYINNHNWPNAPNGRSLKDTNYAYNEPTYIHLGFASARNTRIAKHNYYVARGEAKDPARKMYVECRNAFATWTPGKKLPHGAVVFSYNGPIPEAFRCG